MPTLDLTNKTKTYCETFPIPPLDKNGLCVNEEDLDDAINPTIAVVFDDRIISIIGWERISVGAGFNISGSVFPETWMYVNPVKYPNGTYKLISGLWAAIDTEANRRKSLGKKIGRWVRLARDFAGSQILSDIDTAQDVIENGIADWLQRFD